MKKLFINGIYLRDWEDHKVFYPDVPAMKIHAFRMVGGYVVKVPDDRINTLCMNLDDDLAPTEILTD